MIEYLDYYPGVKAQLDSFINGLDGHPPYDETFMTIRKWNINLEDAETVTGLSRDDICTYIASCQRK